MNGPSLVLTLLVEAAGIVAIVAAVLGFSYLYALVVGTLWGGGGWVDFCEAIWSPGTELVRSAGTIVPRDHDLEAAFGANLVAYAALGATVRMMVLLYRSRRPA